MEEIIKLLIFLITIGIIWLALPTLNNPIDEIKKRL